MFNWSSAVCFPGLKVLAINMPMHAARTVDPMYNAKVFTPILPKVATSLKFPIPAIIENKTNGIAISFKRLMKIVPKGAIQSMVNSLHPMEELSIAHTIPKTNPMIICTGNDGFFMLCISNFLSNGRPTPIAS